MSIPEGAATNPLSISNPRGNKPGACDRCRGQKLRCLREDQSQDSPQATCVRCFKAGAICSYSIAKRAARSLESNALSSQDRRGSYDGKSREGGTTSRPTVNTSGWQNRRGTGGRGSDRLLEEYTADQESEGETENANLDFSALSAASTATLPWPEGTSLFSNNDIGEPSGLEPLNSTNNWDFDHYQAQPMNIQMPTASPISTNEQSRDKGVDAYEIPAQTYSIDTQISGTSDEAMDLDLSPVDEIQHRRMQELSELAIILHRQLMTNDSGKHQPRSAATAMDFQGQLVGSVLKSSNTFLTLLTSFSTSAISLSPFLPSSPAPSLYHNHSTCSFSDNDVSPSASALNYNHPAINEPIHNAHRKLPTSSDDSKPPPLTDITTVLQLLTCYIRIIHLHSIMHARFLDYMLAFLQHTTEHNDFVPPVFPGMQIGGVSLNKFGTFQVKLLLQISVHVLEKIESALGLPEDCRVGKRRSGGAGVLGASVSGEFVKCLMREGAWRGKKVECVREQLGNLRRVLKGAIDF